MLSLFLVLCISAVRSTEAEELPLKYEKFAKDFASKYNAAFRKAQDLIDDNTAFPHIGLRDSKITRFRGLVRNNNLRIPLLNRGSTLKRVPLSKFQNFAGSVESAELVVKRPLRFRNHRRLKNG